MAGPCSAAHGRVTFSSNAGIGKWPRHITAPCSNSLPREVWKIGRDFNSYPVLGGRRRREQAYEFCGAAALAVAINWPEHSWFGKWLESRRSTMANLSAWFPEAATKEPGGRSPRVSG